MQLGIKKLNLQDEEGDQWVIMEMQGNLESRVGDTATSSKFIGDLHFAKGIGSSAPIPTLIIGHHILHGKVVKLDRPMVVMEKREQSEDAMETDNSTHSSHYNVRAVIKKKLLFKTRPKPIIANVPVKL